MSLFYYCISPTGILDFEITTISACGKRVQFESHNGITGEVSIFDKVIIKYNKFLSKFVLVSL